MINWLREHPYHAHAIAFLAMLISSILLFVAVQASSSAWIWLLLSIFVTGNLVALISK